MIFSLYTFKFYQNNCKKEEREDTDSVVLVEKVAPLVLDVEQESEHDHDVDKRDERNNHQTAVHFPFKMRSITYIANSFV